VIEAGADRRAVRLPWRACWVHLWSGQRFEGGQAIEIPAPIGQPPVLFREGSSFADVFRALPTA
jgi:alpha-glucosidase